MPLNPKPHCQVTREVFEASGGRLKVVGRAGVGLDNVDLAAATEVKRERRCAGQGLVCRGKGRHYGNVVLAVSGH